MTAWVISSIASITVIVSPNSFAGVMASYRGW